MNSIKVERFIKGVIKGLITSIFKTRDEEELGNWCLIFLLNVTYIPFAKVLQLHLQFLHMEVINSDQKKFLLLICILNNVFLTHETIDWVRHSKQNMILLRLDFVNAYNKVFWNFMKHKWKWTMKEEISKLLGIAFGLTFEMQDWKFESSGLKRNI
jgi:hypothetical protein